MSMLAVAMTWMVVMKMNLGNLTLGSYLFVNLFKMLKPVIALDEASNKGGIAMTKESG